MIRRLLLSSDSLKFSLCHIVVASLWELVARNEILNGFFFVKFRFLDVDDVPDTVWIWVCFRAQIFPAFIDIRCGNNLNVWVNFMLVA